MLIFCLSDLFNEVSHIEIIPTRLDRENVRNKRYVPLFNVMDKQHTVSMQTRGIVIG